MEASAASMLFCLPLSPPDISPSTQTSQTLKHSLRQRAPSLFDEFVAPYDVLPVSSSLRRVVGAGHPHPELRRMAWLMFLFVLLDTSKGLLVSWSVAHSCLALVPIALCAKNLLSITFGLGMAALLDGMPGVRRCLDIRRSLRVFPVAACFCTAQLAMLVAFRAFNAGSLKIMAQVNLPTMAVLSRLVLGRRYTRQQWAAIALVAAAVAAFMQVRLLYYRPPYFSQGDQAPLRFLGVAGLLCSIFLSCSASILTERFLKLDASERAPFYIQKTNIMLGEVVTSFILTALYLQALESSEGGAMSCCSWEQVLDRRNLLVVLVWAVHGWMAGIMVKQCSAVVKNLGHILSAAVMYFFPLAFIATPVTRGPVSACALLVLIAILVWALAPTFVREKRPQMHHGVHFEPQPPNSQLSTPFLRKVASSTTSVNESESTDAGASSGFPHMGPVVTSFILLDAAKPILVSWAHSNKAPDQGFNGVTLILVQTSISTAIGLLVAARPSLSPSFQVQLHPGYRERVYRCLEPIAVGRQLPVSFCLVMSKLCLIMALEKLDAGSVRVLCQSSLPLVGVCGAVLFRRRYSAMQWCSLAGVTVALGCFYYIKHEVKLASCVVDEQVGYSSSCTSTSGTVLALSSIGFNCLGALLAEKFLKTRSGLLHEQKVQLVSGEVLFNVFLLFIMPFLFSDPAKRSFNNVFERGFFAGWDVRVLICALVWIPSGWTATMLVKEASNVLKVVAQGAASMLTYAFSLTPLVAAAGMKAREPISPPVAVLALSVLFAALTFGLDSVHAGRAPPDCKREDPPNKAVGSTACGG
ncbi:RPS13 [Symbiodinium natans]|uniref:RPS13 protein n=1 Tax=Symbiodinium natans TaxID=878477 RepID=A0A812TRB9_9DINO|nr:RPS13 [Symbiodinium natans]